MIVFCARPLAFFTQPAGVRLPQHVCTAILNPGVLLAVTSEAPPADQPSLTNGFAPSLLLAAMRRGMQPPGFETLEAALPEGIPLGEQDRPSSTSSRSSSPAALQTTAA